MTLHTFLVDNSRKFQELKKGIPDTPKITDLLLTRNRRSDEEGISHIPLISCCSWNILIQQEGWFTQEHAKANGEGKYQTLRMFNNQERICYDMELDECIIGRRSIRRYEDKAVPKEIVNRLLEAGVWAPSGMNAQPWRFVVIENRDTIKKLSQSTKELLITGQWPANLQKAFKSEKDVVFYDAPLLILMCVPKKKDLRMINLLDCGLAAENMFLKAYQEGLGSCFIGFGCFLNQNPKLLEEVGIPEDHELIAPLIFGYPAEKPAPKPRETRILNWIK